MARGNECWALAVMTDTSGCDIVAAGPSRPTHEPAWAGQRHAQKVSGSVGSSAITTVRGTHRVPLAHVSATLLGVALVFGDLSGSWWRVASATREDAVMKA